MIRLAITQAQSDTVGWIFFVIAVAVLITILVISYRKGRDR